MLTLLKIRNLALVDQLLWEPSSGFICITGETGAGKSVIIGAIRLALGERADKTLIRSGEQQCSVEAVFHLPDSSSVHAILNEHGVPPCEDGNLIIKRIISPTANRQFLNDSPCTLNLLREAGACLVDMHGPNDHRSLASHHYLVQKASAGNRTISCLREVDQEERIDELARMLGGGGDHARTLAQALLQTS